MKSPCLQMMNNAKDGLKILFPAAKNSILAFRSLKGVLPHSCELGATRRNIMPRPSEERYWTLVWVFHE